jgi:phosphoserine phosphatase RsbU/P
VELFTILIIDDDPAIGQLLIRVLKTQGYHVEMAADGCDGLAKAKRLRPALIICDWLMPVMNGLELCQQVKSLPELATTFFILITSMDSVDARVMGLDAGADDFLGKPVEINELKARVRAGLRLHQLSEDLQQQKQRLELELGEAANYLRSLLPEPIHSSKLTINWHYVPSLELGGDVFDYYWLDQDHLVIYLLDVSGHGMGSALPALSVLNLLRYQNHPQINYYDPRSVLTTLNQIFPISQRNDKYFTIWYGVYNIQNSQLVYSSAGHPPAILLSNHGHDRLINLLTTTGFPVGFFSDAEYINHTCNIQKSDVLYVFSDGVYEINQGNETLWGFDAWVNFIQQNYSHNLDDILAGLATIQNKKYFDDDLSLLRIDFG